jgi:transcriptional regulator with XRE-family HTH domain
VKRKGTLKQLRLFAGLTRKELAEKLGKSQSTVWNWEIGKTQPNANDIAKLEDVLNIKWADVILVQKGLS